MRSNGLPLKDYTVRVVNTHLTGDLKLVADQIGEWARLQTPIVRLWLFGSRARQTHSPDTDLDVAFEIESLPTNDARDAFDILCESWTAELSDATGLEIHFESIDLEQTQTAVADHGVLIYEQAAVPAGRWLA
jgi:predicted nucleotidyltransferase